MRKYEFTGETKVYEGRTLNRIRRIEDGLIGGWIETEKNLSHSGGCFVYDESMVYENARVMDNAVVRDNAQVYGKATIREYSQVYGNAEIHDEALICGYAQVHENAEVCGNAEVFQYASIFGEALISDEAKVYGFSNVYNCAQITEEAKVFDFSCINGAYISGSVEVCGNACIYEDKFIYGEGELKGVMYSNLTHDKTVTIGTSL